MSKISNPVKLEQFKNALNAGRKIKNQYLSKEVARFHSELMAATQSAKDGLYELGKLYIAKEMKDYIYVLSPEYKDKASGNMFVHSTIIKKIKCEISREDRLNAIEFLSSTGELLKLNQEILEALFQVSQSTISRDIKHLMEENRLYIAEENLP